MEKWQILFGIITSIGVIVSIYFKFRNNKRTIIPKSTDHDGNNIGHQISQQVPKVNNNGVSGDGLDKISSKIIISQKSDKEIRDYIEGEMKNLTLVNADFDQLSQKFINSSVNWIIKVDRIEKDDEENCKVFFDQTDYSRVECFIVNPEDFPIIKFAKRKDKYRIQAQIKRLDSTWIELDRVTHMEKL